eukprot:GHVU01029583.1.p1 GENE.GHVU01029583.1~~GHVU01029583.1.p1  ORF type:complete len:101 (+),score=2.55 GHVU01029583.1:421-723(+)
MHQQDRCGFVPSLRFRGPGRVPMATHRDCVSFRQYRLASPDVGSHLKVQTLDARIVLEVPAISRGGATKAAPRFRLGTLRRREGKGDVPDAYGFAHLRRT